jgi:hypothetical protein
VKVRGGFAPSLKTLSPSPSEGEGDKGGEVDNKFYTYVQPSLFYVTI